MGDFQPDFSAFPNIRSGELSKRDIATRASCLDDMKLLKQAYGVKAKDMSRLGAVYFVAPDVSSVCKIGIAVNPFERLKGIQTGCWERLSIKALFWFHNWDHCTRFEYAALKMGRREGVRLCGEWLDLDWMEAIGLGLTAAANEPWCFTDSGSVAREWLLTSQKQREAHEDDYYTRNTERLRQPRAAA